MAQQVARVGRRSNGVPLFKPTLSALLFPVNYGIIHAVPKQRNSLWQLPNPSPTIFSTRQESSPTSSPAFGTPSRLVEQQQFVIRNTVLKAVSPCDTNYRVAAVFRDALQHHADSASSYTLVFRDLRFCPSNNRAAFCKQFQKHSCRWH